MKDKLELLRRRLSELGSVLLACSGGVDSTFLLKVSKDVLKDRVVAAVSISGLHPEEELRMARQMAGLTGVRLIEVRTLELNDDRFLQNTTERCYWCKRELFSKLATLAFENNINYVIDGSNHDDRDDFRPGMRALKELGVISPLKDSFLGKEEIRGLSRQLGLPTWNKPSRACLASRIPYGTRIETDDLNRIEKAEMFLKGKGFSDFRVRHYGKTARIELLQDEFVRLMDEKFRNSLLEYFKALGYIYISLDLEGLRSGSMNEVLKDT